MGKGKRNRVADAMRKQRSERVPNGSATTMTPLPDELEVPELCPQIGDVVLVHPKTMLVGVEVLPISVWVTSVRRDCLVSGWGVLDPDLCLEQQGGAFVIKQMPLVPFHNLPYSSAAEENHWCWFDDLEGEPTGDDPALEAEAEAAPPPAIIP
jgi:hypothetical protein